MRRRDLAVAAVLGVVLTGGCRKSATPEPSPGTAPAQEVPAAPAEAPPAASAQTPTEPAAAATPLVEVRLNAGNVGAGGPSDQTVFNVGDTVTASLDATALAPGSLVKATWFDGTGAPRGNETKAPAAGNRWLTFSAPGSNAWPEGSYRVDVLVSTGGFSSTTFQIGQGVQTERPGAVPTLAPGD
jgi:pyruvate/2-oxoglutarate dehydrogenase complex dihydrolipoamide acyltransferase (E2) component